MEPVHKVQFGPNLEFVLFVEEINNSGEWVSILASFLVQQPKVLNQSELTVSLLNWE